jgi:hypothetical protein
MTTTATENRSCMSFVLAIYNDIYISINVMYSILVFYELITLNICFMDYFCFSVSVESVIPYKILWNIRYYQLWKY